MSGLVECPSCGRLVSREASACPSCGQPIRRSGCRILDEALGAFLGCAGTLFSLLVIAFVIAFLFGGC